MGCWQRAGPINQGWSYDFVRDQTNQGRRLKWLPILDEHNRECLALEVGYSITAHGVIEILQRLVEERGAREFIRSDNGPEFIAQAVRSWLTEKGMKTLYIEPVSPWENAYSEGFNRCLRDEFLNVDAFGSKLEAKVLGRDHPETYNHRRPHSSLGDLTPVDFARWCLALLRPLGSVEAACAPQDTVNNPNQ
jgi:putative transposase